MRFIAGFVLGGCGGMSVPRRMPGRMSRGHFPRTRSGIMGADALRMLPHNSPHYHGKGH